MLKHWYNVGMEIDMNENNWSNPCPKYDCRKDLCKCGLKYVNIPVGLENEFKPINGAYCNAIVKYEGTGEVYIYSKEGIPTLLSTGNSGNIPQPNLVVPLPNGITTYPAGEEPISLDKVLEAFKAGRSVFFTYLGDAVERVYTVSGIEANDGIRTMKLENIDMSGSTSAGFWLIQSEETKGWESVDYYSLSIQGDIH